MVESHGKHSSLCMEMIPCPRLGQIPRSGIVESDDVTLVYFA